MAEEYASGILASMDILGIKVATGKMWGLDGDSAPILIPNFASPFETVNGFLRVNPLVLVGLSTGKVAFSGQFNLDPTDTTDGNRLYITNGVFATLNLVLNYQTPWGFPAVYGLITNFHAETDVENKAASFSCQVVTSGLIPRSGIIT